MSQLMGGNFCYLGTASENQAYNDAQDKCSCLCVGNEDYYSDSTYGLNAIGHITKTF